MASVKLTTRKFTESQGYQSNLTPAELTERTRKLAQEIFERRGREPGHELEDWLEAEKRIKKELQRF